MIFTSAKVKALRKHLKTSKQAGTFRGTSRRATSLLPAPMTKEDVLLKGASISGYSNLLLSLEANQQSGCLIIQSKKNKSRSGLLIFRGRILGCMRGQKHMENYAFGNLAYKHALDDLQNIGKTVDVYGLKEEIVLAASALFHGITKEEPEKSSSVFLEDTMVELMASNMPGCIVITDREDVSTLVVYVFASQIVGVQSSKDGWLNPDIATVEKYLKTIKNARIRSCHMPCHNLVEVGEYSFSLSGLADRDYSKVDTIGHYYVPNIFYLIRLDEARLRGIAPDAVNVTKFLPKVGHYHLSFLNRLSALSARSLSIHP